MLLPAPCTTYQPSSPSAEGGRFSMLQKGVPSPAEPWWCVKQEKLPMAAARIHWKVTLLALIGARYMSGQCRAAGWRQRPLQRGEGIERCGPHTPGSRRCHSGGSHWAGAEAPYIEAGRQGGRESQPSGGQEGWWQCPPSTTYQPRSP